MRSIVAISSSSQKITLNYSFQQDVTFINNTLINILVNIGLTPIIIPNSISIEECKKVISKVDGLVLIGGQDISPSSYGQECKVLYNAMVKGIGDLYNRPLILAPNEHRDNIEKTMYLTARENGIPILGICRGMQLINIAEGGSLKQEIEENTINHNLEDDGWINYHEIKIIPDTKLSRIIDKDKLFISSIHHQCIDKLGKNIVASAFSIDGIVEAIEIADTDVFIVGIQGHIEKSLKNTPEILEIWKEFGNSVKKQVSDND